MQHVDMSGRPVYSISAVARMLDVPVATIRTWEDRYGLVVPERNHSGHRLYSREQVEQLKYVTTRMSEGASAADAHRLLGLQIESGQPVAAGPGPRARFLVLLAEHDPYAAEFQEYFLKTEGYQVETVFDEASARRIFTHHAPGLVVVEVLISGGSGYELCRYFKQAGSAPVVAVSALECRDEAVAAGADAFLLKPVDPLQFVSTVRDLLGSSAFLSPRQEPATL